MNLEQVVLKAGLVIGKCVEEFDYELWEDQIEATKKS